MPTTMSRRKIISELRKFDVIERLDIITDMWDEIKESRELETISDEEKKLLMNRLANYLSNPDSAIEWATLKQEVYDKYDKKN